LITQFQFFFCTSISSIPTTTANSVLCFSTLSYARKAFYFSSLLFNIDFMPRKNLDITIVCIVWKVFTRPTCASDFLIKVLMTIRPIDHIFLNSKRTWLGKVETNIRCKLAREIDFRATCGHEFLWTTCKKSDFLWLIVSINNQIYSILRLKLWPPSARKVRNLANVKVNLRKYKCFLAREKNCCGNFDLGKMAAI
jgi:hypothetical protein